MGGGKETGNGDDVDGGTGESDEDQEGDEECCRTTTSHFAGTASREAWNRSGFEVLANTMSGVEVQSAAASPALSIGGQSQTWCGGWQPEPDRFHLRDFPRVPRARAPI